MRTLRSAGTSQEYLVLMVRTMTSKLAVVAIRQLKRNGFSSKCSRISARRPWKESMKCKFSFVLIVIQQNNYGSYSIKPLKNKN